MPRPNSPDPELADCAAPHRHQPPGRPHRSAFAPFCLAVLAAALAAGCGGDDAAAVLNADADSAAMAWNTSVTVDVLKNDSSNEGPVTVAAVAPPEHGTAAMVDGQLVYTPEPGWFGVETVTYTASGAGIQVSVPVRIAVQARMTLEGTVADAPLAQAAVKVAVGDDQFSTTTDAQGRYRVEVTADEQADVVRIEAAGSGAQSTVRLVGYAGTAGAVAEGIDAGGVVGAAKAPGLDVSHMSTAIAALISRGKTGAPQTGDALEVALATVSPDAVITLATLLQQVIDGGEALPAGQADTWAFALDAGAARALRDRLFEAGRWWDALSSTLQEAPAVPFVGPATGETSVVLHGGGQSELWLLRADGTGTASADDGSRAITWRVAEGDLAIAYVQPRSSGEFPYVDPQTDIQSLVRRDLTGVRVRLIGAGRLVLRSFLQTDTFVEGARSAEVLRADEPTAWQPAALATALDAYPLDAAELASGARWAGPVLRAPESRFDGLAADVMQVRSTSRARLELAGVERTMSTAEGGFSLKDDAGNEWRYTRLLPAAPDGLETWLVRGRIGTPSAWAVVVPMAQLARPYTPVVNDLAHNWLYEPDASPMPYSIQLNADGTGALAGSAASWALQPDGELRIIAPWGSGVDLVIQWWPVALADGRLLVLFNQQSPPTGQAPGTDADSLRNRLLLSFESSPTAP